MWSFPKDREYNRIFWPKESPFFIRRKNYACSTFIPPVYDHSASGMAMLPSAC